ERRIVITDINEYSLQMARYFGATVALNVATIKNQDELVKQMRKFMSDIGMTEGIDVGLEIYGINSAISMILDVMNHCCKIS
ncbi:L-threonine 3-dehydrogenase, partial [Francisella tularensis subsp. holarctica]|nr:L-threonine 3-dehydrogenase [Francisella tularensis subsp. holarctica]